MDKLEMARETRAALLAFAAGATALTDEQALGMASVFPTWPEGVNADGQYVQGQVVQDEGQLYRVMQPTVTPVENQPPHGEGMLAVYRPIEVEHTRAPSTTRSPGCMGWIATTGSTIQL